ncbi:hypothetical protein DRQ11_11855 [candidate division KSB1 bacterium]|nr:MAG: hypothetical protein DRQ11_11855 [candidate division KSB1 bacterium]
MMVKILITDAHSISNVGSAAVLENTILLLKRFIPEAKFIISANNPETISKFTGEDTITELFIRPAILGTHWKRLKWFLPNFLWLVFNSINLLLTKIGFPYCFPLYTYSRRRKEVIKAYLDSDVVISIGAERINDNFRPQLPFALYGYWFGKMLKKPVVLYAQTIGPFRHKLSRWLTKKILNKVDIITVRDKRSRILLDEMGITNPKIELVADPAILQQTVSPTEAEKLLLAEGVDRSQRPLIGISVLKWTYVNARENKDPQTYYREYVSSIAKLADYLVEKIGAGVVFVSTNFARYNNRDDDVMVAKEVQRQMRHSDKAWVLEKLYSPKELKGIIGQMGMFIASRMHSCIFSTGMAVPTLALNYQFKLYEYMKLLGMEEMTCDFDRVSFDRVRPLADSLWADRNQIRKQLEQRIQALSKASLRSAELVGELLKLRSPC